MLRHHVREFAQVFLLDELRVLIGFAVAGQYDVEPIPFCGLRGAHRGQQRLADGAIRRDEQQQLAAAASHPADLHGGSGKRGQRHFRRRIPEFERLAQR